MFTNGSKGLFTFCAVAVHAMRIGFLIHGVHIALRVSTASDSFILLLYSTLQCSDESIVLTSQPLQDDELFEVRLDSIAGRWSGSLVFGATTVNAENFQFPRLITSCSTGTTFLLSSNKLNKNDTNTIPKDHTSLSVCITRLVLVIDYRELPLVCAFSHS